MRMLSSSILPSKVRIVEVSWWQYLKIKTKEKFKGWSKRWITKWEDCCPNKCKGDILFFIKYSSPFTICNIQFNLQVILCCQVEFISKLTAAGLTHVEATAFVSPKWVPQMADHRWGNFLSCFYQLKIISREVLSTVTKMGHKGVTFPVLTPNIQVWYIFLIK